MRNLLIGILLAGAVVTPAIAHDEGNGRWHRDRQQGDEREPRQPRQQQPQAQVQPQPQPQPQPQRQPQEQPRQERRGQQFNGDIARGQLQGQPGRWDRGHFDGRSNVAPQGGVPQQPFGYRPSGEIQRTPDGGWHRSDRYSGGQAVQQQGWYGQRGTSRPQDRSDNRYYNRSAGGATWSRDWRSNSQYDWRRYRDSHRSVFRLGIYVDPFGYNYRPYTVGYRLPPVYFGQQYWIDPALYELPYPPPGTQWVRYWNDALLVDVYTGAVVDVIQGFFW